jgi:hypothetical protein
MANSCLPEQTKSPKSAKMGFVGIYPYGTIQIFLKVVYKISIPV